MASQENRRCPDCGTELRAIKLIDPTRMTDLPNIWYTVPEASRRFWTGKYPVEGLADQIDAFICDACGRIMVYGVAKQVE